MNLPKKCGQMYIKFDKQGVPEYGFEVKNNYIIKFVPLTDKEINTIILPNLVESPISGNDLKNDSMAVERYLSGESFVCSKCFAGLKKAKIIIPFYSSVKFAEHSFEDKSEIELVLPKTSSLKKVFSRYDAITDYVDERWLLVANKNLEGDFRCGMREEFSVWEFEPKYSKIEFKVSHPTKEQSLTK